MKKWFFLFALITLAALFLRFWHFPQLVNFHLDPPLFMHDVSQMVEEGKLSLIGPRVDSKIIEGRFIFTGPTFYYLLAILALALNWNIVLMTGFFALLWVVTFILIFFWLRQRFGDFIALIVYALLSFLPWLLPYSRIIWNPHLIPFFGILLIWFLEKRGERRLFYLLAGLSFGLAFSIHYAAVLWGPLLLYYLVKDVRGKNAVKQGWLLFAGGAVFANLPFLLFELRHDFYNLRTLVFQFKYFKPSEGYTFSFRSQYYYYIFPFIPLIAKAYALGLEKLKKILDFKILVVSQVVLMSAFFLYSLFGPQREALINPEGWTIERQKLAAGLIIEDNETGFEVATVIDSDTRAGELRWWLKRAGYEPMSVIDYDKTDILYLVAPESRPPETETVWEVKSLRPFKIEKKIDLGEDFIFYKLVRNSRTP